MIGPLFDTDMAPIPWTNVGPFNIKYLEDNLKRSQTFTKRKSTVIKNVRQFQIYSSSFVSFSTSYN